MRSLLSPISDHRCNPHWVEAFISTPGSPRSSASDAVGNRSINKQDVGCFVGKLEKTQRLSTWPMTSLFCCCSSFLDYNLLERKKIADLIYLSSFFLKVIEYTGLCRVGTSIAEIFLTFVDWVTPHSNQEPGTVFTTRSSIRRNRWSKDITLHKLIRSLSLPKDTISPPYPSWTKQEDSKNLGISNSCDRHHPQASTASPSSTGTRHT